MTAITERSKFSAKEELANAISHFIGFLLSIAALVFMLYRSIHFGEYVHIITVAVFGSSMIALYISSALTHFLKQGRLKNFFFSMDRITIYLLIAGTYTPLALVAIGGALGWVIFGIEWACAIAGIILILRKPVNFERGVNLFFVISYAVMGWLFIIAIVPVVKNLSLWGWLMILIGGAFYTIGIFFYKKGRFKFHHLVWHLLVMMGTAAHFISVFCFVLPH
jgi:hemolysin III